MTLSYMNDEVTLDVRDDGRGFSADAALPAADGFDDRSSGFGIPGMRLQARETGGARGRVRTRRGNRDLGSRAGDRPCERRGRMR